MLITLLRTRCYTHTQSGKKERNKKKCWRKAQIIGMPKNTDASEWNNRGGAILIHCISQNAPTIFSASLLQAISTLWNKTLLPDVRVTPSLSTPDRAIFVSKLYIEQQITQKPKQTNKQKKAKFSIYFFLVSGQILLLKQTWQLEND